ncbi:MAG: glycosyltransferase [Anaerolineae bacterium]|nr:glycosyltransferase [Anaerolineae bacterium]
MTKHNNVIANSAHIHYKLATMWHAKGHLDRAVSGYREAISLQPTYVPAHLELGNVLCRQGNFDEAIDVFQRAIDLNPNEAIFPQKLADLLARKKATVANGQNIGLPAATYQQTTANGLGHILLYTDCPGIHGAEQCNQLLMLNLVEAGYRVSCAQSKADHHLIQERHQAGIQHLWLEPDDIYNDPQGANAFTNAEEAAWVINTARPDLIIFSGGCPVSNLVAQQVAARLGIPYLVIVHCVTAAWANKFNAHLFKLPPIYQQAEAVIAVSQENLTLLRQHFGLPNTMGQVLYNGRPNSFFTPVDAVIRRQIRRQLNIPAEAVVVFTSGRMEMVKGYQYQLQAIKQVRQKPVWSHLYFMWAGTGTLESQLRAIIAQIDAEDHVKFLGQRSDIPDLLNAADIFVLSSHFEGMPLSVMEAMAKGLPVIASAVSGTVEELGDAGHLLPNPGADPAGVINGLADTLTAWATDTNLRSAIGRACQQRAERLFQAEPMFNRYLDIIRQTLAKDNNP